MSVLALATHVAVLAVALARLAATALARGTIARMRATPRVVATATGSLAASAAAAVSRAFSTSTRHD